MKKLYLSLLIFFVFFTSGLAQTKGISYQAVIYDPAYKTQSLPGEDNLLIPYANKSICLRFQITDKSNQAIYIETQSTKTDPLGMVNLIIGQGTRIGGSVSNFESINWNTQANGLIVSLDNSGSCASFKEVSNQPFTASPFSMGLSSINIADYEQLINKSNNIIADANSTTKYPSVNAIKSYVDSKVGTIPDADGTTKGKIQLSGDLAGTASSPTVPGLGLKANTSDLSAETARATAAELALTNNVSANTASISAEILRATIAEGLKENIANRSVNISTDATSNTKYPSVKAVKDYVDAQNSAGAVSDGAITSAKISNATIVNEDVAPTAAIDFSKLNILKADVLGLGISKSDLGLGNVDNTSDALKPVSSATVAAITAETTRATAAELTLTNSVSANTASITAELPLKENLSNKSTDFIADASSTDKYPSVKVAKDYIDTYTKDVTTTEVALPTKIDSKQLFSKSGTLSVTAGTTTATIPAISGLTDYYSIRVFKDGRPFRNEVRSFTNGTPIAIITGNGMMSEIYPSGPSGTYTFVLEYFK
jgi:hypothetical protein